MRRAAALCVLPLLLTACSLGGSAPSASQPQHETASASAVSSATPQLAGTIRTVLAQLGLNVHSSPSTSAPVVASAQEGTQLTVLGYQAGSIGWFKVQGQTTTGWIVADPTLTAAGSFSAYSSATRGFSALYPDTWTFSESASDVTFLPQQGSGQQIVVRNASSATAFGQEAQPGDALTFSTQEIVCGYTGQLDEYTSGSQAPSPGASGAATYPRIAVIRLTFDSAHALELRFEYTDASQLAVFNDFSYSIAFPYSLCEAPAAPTPT